MSRKFVFTSFLVLLLTKVFIGQELPPIETFLAKDYKAEDQNWSVSQGNDLTLYFANNKGLLTYNGAKWELYESPNASIVRSVKEINQKIYSGSYMDFGFWVKDSFGILKYTSLVQQNNLSLLEDEEFWNIVEFEKWILFQSLDRIYIYNTVTNSFRHIESENTITRIFKIDKSIYFQKMKDGIFKLENGKEYLVTDNPFLKNKVIINIYKRNNQILYLTKEKGFFYIDDNDIKPWSANLNKQLDSYTLYSSIELKNGTILLGTVSNGIISIDENQQIELKINQSKGLTNNTVLSMFEDQTGNVWLGLDHGINNINLTASFKVFKDNLGALGTVYATQVYKGKLFLGTNQGLFYKTKGTNESLQFVKGTEGQVWFLKEINGILFCGHDKGTFMLDNELVSHISSTPGIWQIKEIENHPNLLIQGHYNGLSILERQDNQWLIRNKIEGFDISSKFLEFISQNELLISHEYKGVYKVELNNNFTKVISYKKIEHRKSVNSSLVKYDSDVFYGIDKGVFKYYKTKNLFIKDSLLSCLYSKNNYNSGKLIATNNKFFVFPNSNISFVQKGKLSSEYEVSHLPIPIDIRETKGGYENILYIGNNQYVIGTTNGYIIAELDSEPEYNYEIQLDRVQVHSITGKSKYLEINSASTLKNSENHIHFSFSIPDYHRYLPSLYQYRLVGFNENWSPWSSNPYAFFENLPHGNYTLEVKGKLGNSMTNNSLSYSFEIDKPWFLKPLVIFLYVFLAFIIVFSVHLITRIYYRKQRKKMLIQKEKELEIKQLENEQQLMHFKNLDLQKDIEAKNRELSISTMNLVKRNELLNNIKKELSKAKSVDDIVKVTNIINDNLTKSNHWKLFEEAFNNSDKDFIKNLKKKHSNLTSNDIRLCTYLRLNLSSKEISPLLNISLRSVEVKRYRLRKKLNLPHEESLTSYILDL